MPNRRDSPRQELGRFTMDGSLRQALEGKLNANALELLIDVVARYCAPRPHRRTFRPDPTP